MMSFFDVFGQSAIFSEGSFDLLGELWDVGRLWANGRQLSQSLVDRFQLLITCQTAPGKWFAGAAIDRIADGPAELFFNLVTSGLQAKKGDLRMVWATRPGLGASNCGVQHHRLGLDQPDCSRNEPDTFVAALRANRFPRLR